MKMTATCWTRCMYQYPPLAHQAWLHWRSMHQGGIYHRQLPLSLPKIGKTMMLLATTL
jgi:hypothetical protein